MQIGSNYKLAVGPWRAGNGFKLTKPAPAAAAAAVVCIPTVSNLFEFVAETHITKGESFIVWREQRVTACGPVLFLSFSFFVPFCSADNLLVLEIGGGQTDTWGGANAATKAA